MLPWVGRFARFTSLLSLVVAITLVVAAAMHQLQWGAPAYRTSTWIPVEIITLGLAVLLVIPQVVATVYLIVKRRDDARSMWIGVLAVVSLPASIVLAIVLDAATLIYAT